MGERSEPHASFLQSIGEIELAKTYVPSLMNDIHEIAVYLARYNSTIIAAITVIDPSALEAYNAVYTAILALDAFKQQLTPLGP